MIEWNDSLSVHVMEIDNQHKGLIDLINDIYELIRSGIDDKMQVISIISDLRAYTVVHFGTEERYMDSYDYPDIQLHKNEHKYFVDKVCDVEDKCIDGSCIMSMDLLNF